jgi:hypothetical protein
MGCEVLTSAFKVEAELSSLKLFLACIYQTTKGRDSIVGIATRHELDSVGIESWWGRDFLHPAIPALKTTQPPVHWVPSLFLRGKMAGAWH